MIDLLNPQRISTERGWVTASCTCGAELHWWGRRIEAMGQVLRLWRGAHLSAGHHPSDGEWERSGR